jgi:hypothetical protein
MVLLDFLNKIFLAFPLSLLPHLSVILLLSCLLSKGEALNSKPQYYEKNFFSTSDPEVEKNYSSRELVTKTLALC